MRGSVLLILFTSVMASRGDIRSAGRVGACRAAAYFVKTDFDAVGDHFGLVKPRADSKDPTSDLEFSCMKTGVVVVTSYRIEACKVNGERAVASVRYHRVGAVDGGRVILSKEERYDVVDIELVYEGGQWWVAKPMPSHVSANALQACFERYYVSLTPDWWSHASAAQKDRATAIIESIEELKRWRSGRGRHRGH